MKAHLFVNGEYTIENGAAMDSKCNSPKSSICIKKAGALCDQSSRIRTSGIKMTVLNFLEGTLVNVEGDVPTDATYLEFVPDISNNPAEVTPAKTIIKFPSTRGF